MDNNELIGRVAAAYFSTRLQDGDASSPARYLLDQFSAEQTVAIAKAILASTTLEPLIDIRLPKQWLGHHGLPAHWRTGTGNRIGGDRFQRQCHEIYVRVHG